MAHNQGGNVTFSPDAKCSEYTYTYPVFGDQVFLMLIFPDVTMYFATILNYPQRLKKIAKFMYPKCLKSIN